MGEEATSPHRDTKNLGGSMSLRHKRKHAALQDTAESPPAAVIDPLLGLDRPTRQARNAAASTLLETANTTVKPTRVSKRLSMKADEPIPVPVKKVIHLSKTARIAAAKKAGPPHATTAANALPSVQEDTILEDADRPRRAQKLPKRFDESILLETKMAPPSAAAPAPAPVAAPKLVQNRTVSAPAAVVSKQRNVASANRNLSEITLGCSKCRFTPKRCGRCKAAAAAAGANVTELIAAADRAKNALKNGTTSVPKRGEVEKKRRSNAQQEENATVVRRVSARHQGIDAALAAPSTDASLNAVKEKEEVPKVVEPSVTEKKRGRKPANKPAAPAAPPAVEEPAAIEVEDTLESVPAPAITQDMLASAAGNTKETEPKSDGVEKQKKESNKKFSPLKRKAAASPPRNLVQTAQQEVLVPGNEGQQDNKEDEEESWWNPLDPAKVSQAQAALHVSCASVPGQELPLCRERQITAIDSWLADRLQTAQGGSLYLSGLPGTGKSLTALELVRRCGRHLSQPVKDQTAATSGSSNNSKIGFSSPPPALIAVNCMRFSEPRQAVERILAGYHTACRQVEGKDSDPLVQVPDEGAAEVVANRRRKSSLGVGGGAGGSGIISSTAMTPQELLRQIVLQRMPTVAPATAGRQNNQKKGGRRSSAATAAAAATGNTDTSAPAASAVSALGGDGRGMIVAVLDELDGLLTGPRGDALVGELFALAHAPRSRLILIGIANSIDLVQQLMRPGGSLHRHNLRPKHEIFPAYMSSQVAELITQRISRLPGPVFDPKTIQFCARKIANGNGDMRRALEACARAISIVATEEQKKATASTTAETSGNNGQNTNNQNSVEVGMRHMAAALAQVTGGIGASNDSVNAIRKLPVPQQLLMATVAKLLGERMGSRGLAVKVPTAPGLGGASAAARFIGTAAIAQPLLEVGGGTTITITPSNKGTFAGIAKKPKMARNSLADAHRRRSSSIMASSKELNVGDLRAAHAGLCKRVGVAAYSQIEFNVAIDTLCTMGLVELKGGAGKGPLQRVGLQIAEDDVLMALADVPVLKDVVGA